MAELLGRAPMGGYAVVVRRVSDRTPVVIRNASRLEDGTPMPTRYWLVGDRERVMVGRVEAAGGVRRAEAAVDPAELAAAHDRYAADRNRAAARTEAADAANGPGRPTASGGVGGTRRGVKCLHAHYAWWLAGGDDPVGRWTHQQLSAMGSAE